MNKDIFARVGILIAIVIAIGFGAANQIAIHSLAGSTSFGAIGTRFPDGVSVGTTVAATKNKLTVGSSGNAIAQYMFGTCNLTVAGTFTVTATTSKVFSCAATGVASGDNVVISPATSTQAYGDWVMTGAIASTTASNDIEVTFLNLTGGNAVIPAGLASSTKWRAMR